jgi:hypothetical protein
MVYYQLKVIVPVLGGFSESMPTPSGADGA